MCPERTCLAGTPPPLALCPGVPSALLPSRFWGVAVLRFRYLALSVVVSAGFLLAPGAHATAAGFTVSGNKILDPTGATFTMRGSNILFDTELDGFGRTPERDVPPMVDKWHLNTVRLLVSEDFWIGSQQTIDGAANPNYCSAFVGYQERIDNWVAKATARHMLVLIDLHTNELNGV